jgi:hypothetical protein
MSTKRTTEEHRGEPAMRTTVVAAALLAVCLAGRQSLAQETASLTIDDDCKVFAIAPDNSIVYAVPHLKRFEKLILERDEIWVSSPKGGKRKIVDPDKFMPLPPPASYIVGGLSWSPDGQRIAVSMQTKTYPWSPKVKGKKKGSLDDDYEDDNTEEARRGETGPAASGGGRVVALVDGNGQEIKVANSKTRFIEGASLGAWLADGKTMVYLGGTGANQIVRVSPDDGKTTTLFSGRRFNAVRWDAQRNRAFAIGEGMGFNARFTLSQLDLLHETISEVAKLDAYNGSLAVSPNGTAVGYFRDGDTIEVRSLANPTKATAVHAGIGRFEFDRDDRRVLLKRGPEDRSNDLIWVRLDDGSFSPILHDLVYHDFHVSPDGRSLGVSDPGKSILRIYPLE